MAVQSSSRACYLMDRDRQLFWHCSLKGKTTEITVGRAGSNPRHYPRRQHVSPQAARTFVTQQVARKTATGYILREDGRKFWTYGKQGSRCTKKGHK